LREENHRLREENQALRDEVARLKGQKGKPSIGPSRLNQKARSKRRGRRHRHGPARQIDRTEVVKATGVPEGSRFKGYSDFDVQELVIKTETVRYRVENWYTAEGKLISGVLPTTVVAGSHFGPTLQSFILYQYFHALVTEPLLLEQLREFGVEMSSGQLHRLVTEGKEHFTERRTRSCESVCGSRVTFTSTTRGHGTRARTATARTSVTSGLPGSRAPRARAGSTS
jgi:hypothetical protein